MIKYFGGAILVSVGWLIGNSLCSIYYDRVELLTYFREFVSFCESEITFYRTNMDEIIEKFRQKNTKTYKYSEAIFYPDNHKIFITKEYGNLIKNFFEKVRELDTESQKGLFAEVTSTIDSLTQKAEYELNNKGKMLKKLLPIAAIGIFILCL